MSPAPEPEQHSANPALTGPQLQVLAYLVEGRSISWAAVEMGIHRNTIRNWRLNVPAFARELELAMREQTLVWRERCNDLAPRALDVLDNLLDNYQASPVLRLRAALAVLKTANEVKVESPIVHNTEIQNSAQSCTTSSGT